MDPRKLLYFATIVEQGSFKKAAKQLLVSQPALSTSMDRFEQSLGYRLLDRSPTGVTPTVLGEVLYGHARLLREELERAEERVSESRALSEELIAFGVLPSLATSIVPAAVCRWRQAYPTSTLRIVEKHQLDLLLSLLRGEVDFIVAQTEYYGLVEGLKQRVLFRDRLYILCRPGHPASEIEAPSWAYLAKFPWVVARVGRQRMLLEKLLASEDVSLPEQLTECGSVDCMKSLIAGSDSLAMLPASAVSEDVRLGKIVPIDITEPLLNRDIAVLFHQGVPLTAARRDLLAEIEKIGSEPGGGQLTGQAAA